MKTYIQNIIKKYEDKEMHLKIGAVKEYLQENILYIIYLKGFMEKLIFEGGTALRFLYGLKRFSEDIDFSTKIPLPNIDRVGEIISKELMDMGYKVEFSVKSLKSPVKKIFFKFPDILKDMHIPFQKGQKISVLLEIDTNPPMGGKTETTILNREYIFIIRHYTLSSLMAKKLHAVLFRKFIKGRDYYDLFWFLSRKVVPDFGLLNNAVRQTYSGYKEITKENWKNLLLVKLQTIDFEKIRKDILPFLEVPSETNLLTIKNFSSILNQ